MSGFLYYESSSELDPMSSYPRGKMLTEGSTVLSSSLQPDECELAEFEPHELAKEAPHEESEFAIVEPIDLDKMFGANTDTTSKLNTIELSLDDIPLTSIPLPTLDTEEKIDFSAPDKEWMLLPIPEHLQNDASLDNLTSVVFDQELIDKINSAVTGFTGAILLPPSPLLEPSPPPNQVVIRRAPLQLVQQVINFPVKKNLQFINDDKDEDLSKHKRKQKFNNSREDTVFFFSSDEEDDIKVISSKIVQPIELTDIQQPQVALTKINVEEEKSKLKSNEKNCPRCHKSFKKLNLHKCKGKIELHNPVLKLKPSQVPMPFKCEICKLIFHEKSSFDDHIITQHSDLICKLCKYLAKTPRGFKIHYTKCKVAGLKRRAISKKSKKMDKEN